MILNSAGRRSGHCFSASSGALFFGFFGDGSQGFRERLRRLADADPVGQRLGVRAETVDAEVDQQVLGFGEHDVVVQLETATLARGLPCRCFRAFENDKAFVFQRVNLVDDLVFLEHRALDDLRDGVRLLQTDEDAALADAQLVEPVLEFIFALGGDAETGRCFHVIPLP